MLATMDERQSTGPISQWLNTAQPEALFVLSAVAQYIGAAIAVLLFTEVEPQTVAWFRVMGAGIALLVISRGWWRGWTQEQLIAVALFGITTALMNIFFYLAIDRIDLGKGVTIEFIGPILVAALTTRSLRNGVALSFAIAGVVMLGGGEIDNNLSGIVFILIASALWALYIVFGARVAHVDRGVVGLGLRPDRRPMERTGLGLPSPSWALSPGRRLLERRGLRHRPVHLATYPNPAVLAAARIAAGHRITRWLDCPRPTTFDDRCHRHRVGLGRGRRAGT